MRRLLQQLNCHGREDHQQNQNSCRSYDYNQRPSDRTVLSASLHIPNTASQSRDTFTYVHFEAKSLPAPPVDTIQKVNDSFLAYVHLSGFAASPRCSVLLSKNVAAHAILFLAIPKQLKAALGIVRLPLPSLPCSQSAVLCGPNLPPTRPTPEHDDSSCSSSALLWMDRVAGGGGGSGISLTDEDDDAM